MSDQLEGLTVVVPETIPQSYSQHGEDKKAVAVLDRWKYQSGRVLEIGAWHPTALSNSRLLIECGWEAVLVEPSPAKLHALAKEYQNSPRVIVVGAAVSVHGGWIKLNISEDALSTEVITDQWRESGGFYGSVWFNAITIRDLISWLGGDFAVVSIDTEGTSVDLFADMCATGMRPRVVIVEHDGRLPEVQAIAEAANYKVEWFNGTNIIFEWQGPKD